VVTLSLIYNR